ncbi:unnamed protein product [Pleuronectes platessa]|uniref:Uncharacterized protein n=1 Tax=Pleuronectes platessa TaxID=8262 RepID=A0A9N7YVF9_PLEPL|nr:unnamed protein product [Pleuronectes platessa]
MEEEWTDEVSCPEKTVPLAENHRFPLQNPLLSPPTTKPEIRVKEEEGPVQQKTTQHSGFIRMLKIELTLACGHSTSQEPNPAPLCVSLLGQPAHVPRQSRTEPEQGAMLNHLPAESLCAAALALKSSVRGRKSLEKDGRGTEEKEWGV